MKKFLLKKLIPFISQIINGEAEIITDESGTYIKVKFFLLGETILNRRLYLSRKDSGDIPNQLIKIK